MCRQALLQECNDFGDGSEGRRGVPFRRATHLGIAAGNGAAGSPLPGGRDLGPARLRKELEVNASEVVTFTQTGAAANSFRDAIRFWHGRTVLLQELEPGQRVEVLDLSMAEEPRIQLEEFSETLLRRR